MNCAVIFGGSGFIGTFFAKHLIEEHNFSKVYLYDNESIKNKNSDYRRKIINLHQEIIIIEGDVKKSIEWIPEETINLVANFAAVHREPGHQPYEYYECNILGAENICDWVERINCKKIIFTSSIAPYGPSEEIRNELSIPVPVTPYGCSKLVAEKFIKYGNQKRKIVN